MPIKQDGRVNNGGKGGRKKLFEEGTSRVMISVPAKKKQEYTSAINQFVQSKYQTEKKPKP